MIRLAPLSLLLCLGLLCAAIPARGGAVQFQLGEQDFSDGKAPIYSAEIRAAGAGEPFPFDGTLFGNDLKSAGLGGFEFLHTFDLGGHAPLAAKLTVGLIDIDSPPEHPLETVEVTFDGMVQPTGILTGISALGWPSSVEVVDITVPVELLSDGVLHVGIAARLAGYGNIGNAIEADFSRLVVETAGIIIPGPIGPEPGPGPIVDPVLPPIVDPGPRPAPQPVPLPPTLVPAGVVLLGLAVRRGFARR